MNQISKTIKIVTITFVLLGSSFGIPGCVRQDQHGLGQRCYRCYNSKPNSFGSCSPLDQAVNCLIWDQAIGSRPKCFKCKPDYFVNKDGACKKRTSTIPNCVNHYTTTSADSIGLKCRECTEGYPESKTSAQCLKRDLYNCEVGHRYREGYDPAAPSPEERDETKFKEYIGCAVCKQGYTFYQGSYKRECRRSSSSRRGCSQIGNYKDKCEECKFLEGYFSDGINRFEGGGLICKKLQDHFWMPKEVKSITNGNQPNLDKKSIFGVLPNLTRFTNYAEFREGFVAVNGSAQNFYIHQKQTDDKVHARYIEFAREVGQTQPYYRFYKNYTFRRRTSELLRCSSNAICVILDDTESLNERTGEKEVIQEVFIFNATQPDHNGVIYRNKEARNGKFISNLLPISHSSYTVLGFSTTSTWRDKEDTRLLRVDYFNTSTQFAYSIIN